MKKSNRTMRQNDGTVDNDEDDEDPLKKEKSIVRKKISQLEDLISEIEFSLNLKRFGNIQPPSKSRPQRDQKRPNVQKFKNLDYILQHELCKLSGLYCTKCTKHEFIFNFSPFSTTKSTEIYGVQFFTTDQRGTMGKYIMPTSGIMENILAETPIDQLTGLIPFFRNCRRHLDCFVNRKEQFESLRSSVENVKNLYLDADVGFVFITFILRQCYRKDADKFVDLTVHLSYDYGKARPSTINVDWNGSKPREEETKAMRSFVKAFKTLGLKEAVEEIKGAKHKVFTWRAEEREDGAGDASLRRRGREEEAEDEEEEEVEVEARVKGTRSRPKERKQSADAGKRQKKAAEGVEEEGEVVGVEEEEGRVEERLKSKRGRPKKRKQSADTGKQQKKAVEAVEEVGKEEPAKKKRAGGEEANSTFARPKTRQSLLNFKKIDETIGSSEGKTATTSTPMRRNVEGGGKNKLKVLEISPIVKDVKGATKGRKPAKKK